MIFKQSVLVLILYFLELFSNFVMYYMYIPGHLTGCGGADPHNSPTSASSASLGHFSA